MRISSQSLRDLFVAQLGIQQTNLARTQLQVSTGLRFNRPAEDPVAAAQSLDLLQVIARNDQYTTNSNLATNRLQLSEGTLATVGNTLQRLRELAIQAATATTTADDRQLIASEVQQRLAELVAFANTQDGNGQYLYAGFSTTTQPFSSTAAGFVYNGDQGQRLVQIGAGRTIADSDSGATVFQLIRNGNGTFSVAANGANAGSGVVEARGVTDLSQYDGGTYNLVFLTPTTYEVRDTAAPTPNVVASGTYVSGQNIVFKGLQLTVTGTPAANDSFTVRPSANQDMFTTVQNFMSALNTKAYTPAAVAQLRNQLNNSLQDLDQSIGNVLRVRADVGGRLQSIDSQLGANSELGLQLKSTLSQTRDLDYAEAITRLNQQLVGLQAAQQTYTRVMGLSLFNYLR